VERIAHALGVPRREVVSMSRRLSASDHSLNVLSPEGGGPVQGGDKPCQWSVGVVLTRAE
jgi:hypothetical protein